MNHITLYESLLFGKKQNKTKPKQQIKHKTKTTEKKFYHPSPECISHSFAMLLQNFVARLCLSLCAKMYSCFFSLAILS